jgi:hypothetical protein
MIFTSGSLNPVRAEHSIFARFRAPSWLRAGEAYPKTQATATTRATAPGTLMSALSYLEDCSVERLFRPKSIPVLLAIKIMIRLEPRPSNDISFFVAHGVNVSIEPVMIRVSVGHGEYGVLIGGLPCGLKGFHCK